MEPKNQSKYLPGWQMLGYPVTEFDENTDNERSENEEYNFYNFTGKNNETNCSDVHRGTGQL